LIIAGPAKGNLSATRVRGRPVAVLTPEEEFAVRETRGEKAERKKLAGSPPWGGKSSSGS